MILFMKNIYELTAEEKDKYKDEFNKLEFTKKINTKRFSSLLIIFLSLTASVILGGLIEDGNTFLTDFQVIAFFIAGISIITYTLAELTYRISFVRYIKIKHKIEY